MFLIIGIIDSTWGKRKKQCAQQSKRLLKLIDVWSSLLSTASMLQDFTQLWQLSILRQKNLQLKYSASFGWLRMNLHLEVVLAMLLMWPTTAMTLESCYTRPLFSLNDRRMPAKISPCLLVLYCKNLILTVSLPSSLRFKEKICHSIWSRNHLKASMQTTLPLQLQR